MPHGGKVRTFDRCAGTAAEGRVEAEGEERLMRALVVYESMYGNTAAIAEAIAASLRTRGIGVDARPASKVSATEVAEVDLLVVGGPTHVHGMSRTATRKTAAEDTANTFAGMTIDPGLRDWLVELGIGHGRLAAAFDTRIDKPVFFTGSAARGIARRLSRLGFRLVVPPQSFLVTPKNHLLSGETKRATAWGAALGRRAMLPASK